MSGICKDRVVIVTGAGRGIGREHALELGRQGAKVVVNDLGATNEGDGRDTGPAAEVVGLITAMGGEAFANGADVADFEQARILVQQTVDTFGRLDVVVNNAGFVRDQFFFKADEASWDAVLRVHVKGHFCIARHAAEYWRDQSKAGAKVDARIINTSSGAGIFGSVAQSAYSTAKGAIATLTLVQAAELARLGVTANAICPIARTRMTEKVFSDAMGKPDTGFDANDPSNVAPLVAWLASSESRDITGRIFEVVGGCITLLDGFHRDTSVDVERRWAPAELGPQMRRLIAEGRPQVKVYGT